MDLFSDGLTAFNFITLVQLISIVLFYQIENTSDMKILNISIVIWTINWKD